jgi:hypothetical protein
VIPDERRLDSNLRSHSSDKPATPHAMNNLQNISSFANLNSSMLFLPKSSYINQETVMKVMQQQQMSKRETLSDTNSVSSSSTSSPLVHVRHRLQQMREDTSSSGESSASSQRDSGLSSGMNDESSDGSPRDSLIEHDNGTIDGLIKQTQHLAGKFSLLNDF